mgnify:CR=1 FL=1
MCTDTLAIESFKLQPYRGGYEAYLVQLKERGKELERQVKKQEDWAKELRKKQPPMSKDAIEEEIVKRLARDGKEVAARWNGGAVERAGVGSPIVSSTLKTVTGIPGYTFESLPGQSYAVEVTSDPVSGPWTTISTIIGNGGPTTAFDTSPGAANRILRYNLSIGQ